MASPTEISCQNLARLVGLPDCPALLDVRTEEDFAADPQLIPTAIRRDWRAAGEWADAFAGREVVVICERGLKLSQGAAALLRHGGAAAVSLEGGIAAWREAGLPVLKRLQAAPGPGGRWVTRLRPKVDRIACPWLIRRFIDRDAVFLFVAPSEVQAVAERFGATPFDIEGVFWSHRGETCTFDTMIAEFGLAHPPLDHLARIVRGADTARPDLEPEAAGLLAISLGLSRQYKDDLAQLDAGMHIYDALYRWCRDARGETHNWPNPGTSR